MIRSGCGGRDISIVCTMINGQTEYWYQIHQKEETGKDQERDGNMV